MKLFRYLTLLFLVLPTLTFSQNDFSEKDSIANVFICLSEVSKTFHSYEDCIGLETCEKELEELSEEIAIRKYDRAVCCICWTNPGDDCKNDNPNATYDYEEEERRREVFFEDFLWFEGGGVYAFVGAFLGSVILLSNEVFIGTSYSILPPKLSVKEIFDINTSLGFSLLFRKNLKKDAVEYGFNFHSFEFNTDQNSPSSFEADDRFMFSVSYLHQMNQHFSDYSQKPSKIKFFLGPLVTFGSQDLFNNQDLNKFGVGVTGSLGIPLGKRVNIDLRSDITNYSTEVKLGLRWFYQKKYPWQRRRN
ncbi:MAG: hypothetical protein AB8F94_27680 [Saprospiraceae bacterium]